ncbi:MAG: glycosyltransferase family 4 protein [bacterium]|nr:glycosyltransferase family 4 protein [bacterium]
MLKIAYLGIKGLPSKGGAERVVEPIVHALSSRQKLTVYCNSRYTPQGTKIGRVRLVRIPTLPGKYLQPVSFFILSALHALFKGNYDLIHVHNVEACFILPLLRIRYRVIATSHGSPIRAARSKWGPLARTLMGLTEYPYLLLSNCATSVSRADAEYFKQVRGRKVVYLPNGIREYPVDHKLARQNLKEMGLSPSRYILFAAGRIDPTKGCHLVLEAFNKLNLNLPLVIVGDLAQVPHYAQGLRQMADERVVFIPHIADKEKLFGLVRNCRLFIFPSLVEAMSMMLLEVAVMGVPLICSDIPENKDILDKHAVYFQSGNAEDLARKMRWALDHPDLMNSYAKGAQAWVKSHYSWERMVKGYETLYEKIAG